MNTLQCAHLNCLVEISEDNVFYVKLHPSHNYLTVFCQSCGPKVLPGPNHEDLPVRNVTHTIEQFPPKPNPRDERINNSIFLLNEAKKASPQHRLELIYKVSTILHNEEMQLKYAMHHHLKARDNG